MGTIYVMECIQHDPLSYNALLAKNLFSDMYYTPQKSIADYSKFIFLKRGEPKKNTGTWNTFATRHSALISHFLNIRVNFLLQCT